MTPALWAVLVPALSAFLVGAGLFLRSAAKSMARRGAAAELQARSAEAALKIAQTDLQLKRLQLEMEGAKVQEMRRSRRLQQRVCKVGEDELDKTGEYHIGEDEAGELRWEDRTRGERGGDRPKEAAAEGAAAEHVAATSDPPIPMLFLTNMWC